MASTAFTSVVVEIPPDPRMLRILRLMVSGLASLADFGLAATEEVRVAVDELGSTLIGASDGSDIRLTLEVTDTGVCVEGTTTLAADAAPLDVDPLVNRLLDAVATRHSWTARDGQVTGRFEKHIR